MLRIIALSMVIALASVTALTAVEKKAAAENEVASGLKPGASVPAFLVRDVTGPRRGDTLCYRCKYGGSPVVSIFARRITPQLASLIKSVDAQVAKNKQKGLKAFVVFLSDEPKVMESKLERLAKDQRIAHTPLTLIEGTAGPRGYKVAQRATVTVMMWVDSHVVVNHAFEKDGLNQDAIKQIVVDTEKILID